MQAAGARGGALHPRPERTRSPQEASVLRHGSGPPCTRRTSWEQTVPEGPARRLRPYLQMPARRPPGGTSPAPCPRPAGASGQGLCTWTCPTGTRRRTRTHLRATEPASVGLKGPRRVLGNGSLTPRRRHDPAIPRSTRRGNGKRPTLRAREVGGQRPRWEAVGAAPGASAPGRAGCRASPAVFGGDRPLGGRVTGSHPARFGAVLQSVRRTLVRAPRVRAAGNVVHHEDAGATSAPLRGLLSATARALAPWAPVADPLAGPTRPRHSSRRESSRSIGGHVSRRQPRPSQPPPRAFPGRNRGAAACGRS